VADCALCIVHTLYNAFYEHNATFEYPSCNYLHDTLLDKARPGQYLVQMPRVGGGFVMSPLCVEELMKTVGTVGIYGGSCRSGRMYWRNAKTWAMAYPIIATGSTRLFLTCGI
jgi:hypothetical protein